MNDALFHFRAMAAAGNRRAKKLLKGFDLLREHGAKEIVHSSNWTNKELGAEFAIFQTNVIHTQEHDTPLPDGQVHLWEKLRPLGWFPHDVNVTMTQHDVVFVYHWELPL
jgi:hypothetical protein